MSRVVTEWASGLRLSSRDKAIVYSLARFADDTGVVYGLTYDDLANEFGCSRITIARLVRRLKASVGLGVEQRNLGSRKYTAFYLPITAHRQPNAVSLLPGLANGSAGGAGLKRVLSAGLERGFSGKVGEELLVEIKKVLFKARESGRIQYFDNNFATVAWMEAAERASELVVSANPGDLLIKWVFREFNATKLEDLHTLDLLDEQATFRAVPVVYQASSNYVVTYDDLLEVDPLRNLIVEFMDFGVAPKVAFAGTLRVVQLCVSARWSYKHTEAAKDPFLRSLGIDPAVARKWVSLVIGPRNSKITQLAPSLENIQSVVAGLVA